MRRAELIEAVTTEMRRDFEATIAATVKQLDAALPPMVNAPDSDGARAQPTEGAHRPQVAVGHSGSFATFHGTINEETLTLTPDPAATVTLADLMVTILNGETIVHQLYGAYNEGHFGTVIRDVATAMLPVVNGGR